MSNEEDEVLLMEDCLDALDRSDLSEAKKLWLRLSLNSKKKFTSSY